MKKGKFQRRVLALGIVLCAVVIFSSEAFPWGSATHVYIVDHLNKKQGLTDMDEARNRIYGGNGPDFFNYAFNEYSGYLYPQTHDNFMTVWDAAGTVTEKALAYGFVSHNDVWGADSTAHHSGITYGQDEGYIIAKAYILRAILEQIPGFNALGLPENIALDVSHNLVENGVDILIKRMEPSIGQKLMDSAIYRSDEFPAMLINAYAGGLSEFFGITYEEASGIIDETESEFRNNLIDYGYVLTQDEDTAVQLISDTTASLAMNYLAAYGIGELRDDGTLKLSDGSIISSADLFPLIEYAVRTSMDICESDFKREIKATIGRVNGNLSSHNISY